MAKQQNAGYFQFYDSASQSVLFRGCDISSYQGTPNFTTMYNAGARFVYIKAGGYTYNYVTGRYIRVSATGNSAGSSVILRNIDVYGYDPATSSDKWLSAGKTVTASKTPDSGTLSNLTNGSSASSSEVNIGTNYQWATVDLGASYTLKEFQINTYVNVFWKDFKVEISADNTTWTTVFYQAGTGTWKDKTVGTGSNGLIFIPAIRSTSINATNFTKAIVTSARNAGLKVGFYWFKNPAYFDRNALKWNNLPADAQSEANTFKGLIDGLGLGAGDYGDVMPMLDWENNLGNIYPSVNDDGAYDFVEAFVNQFKATTTRPVILYTAFYTNETMDPTPTQFIHSTKGAMANVCPLWLSGVASTYPNYNLTAFGGWSGWTIWQYSTDGNAKGSTYGVATTDIDLDYVENLNSILIPITVPVPSVVINLIRIYISTETNFNSNGLGILKDAISCKVTEELNGIYEAVIEYPATGWLADQIVAGNIIKVACGHPSGNDQLFRIKNIRRSLKKIIISAFHIFYDLGDNFLEDTSIVNKDGTSGLSWLFSNTQFNHSFTAFSDISAIRSARYVRKSVTNALLGTDNSFVSLYDGELLRDNFTVKVMQNRGQDRGVQIRYGKNLTEIDWSIDQTGVATRIMPIGYDGLLLPEKYIDSQFIGSYPNPKVKLIEYTNIKIDEDNGITQDMAYAQLRNAVNDFYLSGADQPKVNIKVNFIELSKIKEYASLYSSFESIYLGDIITAIIPYLNLTVSLKIIKTVYDTLKGKYESFEIGDFKTNYVETSMNNMEEHKTQVEAYSENTLQEAKDYATAQITSAMGGYIYKTANELYIMDDPNPTTALKIWRWNLNGLGYSSTGIAGPYGLAMTQDGKIVADFIKTGVLDGNLIKANSITLGQIGTQTVADIKSSLLNNVVTIDNNGIQVTNVGSQTLTKIDNDEFSVYNAGAKVLTVNQDLTILARTQINQDFTIGKVKFINRTNGTDIVYIS